MNKQKKNLSVIDICQSFHLCNVSQDDIDKLFETMCWQKTNEVHVFSFVAFMFLMEVAPLPVSYTSNYPEGTVRVINTIKYYKCKFSFIDLLHLEYGCNEPTNEKGYVELLVNFTLCFINLWQKKINPNFKMENNLFIPEGFKIKRFPKNKS